MRTLSLVYKLLYFTMTNLSTKCINNEEMIKDEENPRKYASTHSHSPPESLH